MVNDNILVWVFVAEIDTGGLRESGFLVVLGIVDTIDQLYNGIGDGDDCIEVE